VIAELAVREGSQVAVDAPLVTVIPPSTTEASGASL